MSLSHIFLILVPKRTVTLQPTSHRSPFLFHPSQHLAFSQTHHYTCSNRINRSCNAGTEPLCGPRAADEIQRGHPAGHNGLVWFGKKSSASE